MNGTQRNFANNLHITTVVCLSKCRKTLLYHLSGNNVVDARSHGRKVVKLKTARDDKKTKLKAISSENITPYRLGIGKKGQCKDCEHPKRKDGVRSVVRWSKSGEFTGHTRRDTRTEGEIVNESKGTTEGQLMEETIGRERNGYCLAYEESSVLWAKRKEEIYNLYD